uniref:Uncharacterized protein n=1 Tax=Romanomermis culicivorax TaxID=13658 RepID=A0A915JJS8_ROMCU
MGVREGRQGAKEDNKKLQLLWQCSAFLSNLRLVQHLKRFCLSSACGFLCIPKYGRHSVKIKSFCFEIGKKQNQSKINFVIDQFEKRLKLFVKQKGILTPGNAIRRSAPSRLTTVICAER